MRTAWHRLAVGLAVSSFALLLAGPSGAATIASFQPQGGVTAADSPYCDGTIVTINGSGFVLDGPASAVSVTFNGTPATFVQIGSDSTINAAVPKGATTGKITVTTAAGTASSPTAETIVACPGRDHQREPADHDLRRRLGHEGIDLRVRAHASAHRSDRRDPRNRLRRRDGRQTRRSESSLHRRLSDQTQDNGAHERPRAERSRSRPRPEPRRARQPSPSSSSRSPMYEDDPRPHEEHTRSPLTW